MAAPRTCYLDPGRDYVRVKTGFSWPAFFLGSLWAAVKRMWVVAALMLLVECTFWFGNSIAAASGNATLVLLGFILQIVYCVVRGRYGNAWRRAALARRGYRVVVEKRSPVT
jgi:hypothetical protein